jgi:hypothetical protein
MQRVEQVVDSAGTMALGTPSTAVVRFLAHSAPIAWSFARGHVSPVRRQIVGSEVIDRDPGWMRARSSDSALEVAGPGPASLAWPAIDSPRCRPWERPIGIPSPSVKARTLSRKGGS